MEEPHFSQAGVTLRSEVPAQPETETVLCAAGPGQDRSSLYSARGLAQNAPGTQVRYVRRGPTGPVSRVAAPSGRPSLRNPSPIQPRLISPWFRPGPTRTPGGHTPFGRVEHDSRQGSVPMLYYANPFRLPLCLCRIVDLWRVSLGVAALPGLARGIEVSSPHQPAYILGTMVPAQVFGPCLHPAILCLRAVTPFPPFFVV